MLKEKLTLIKRIVSICVGLLLVGIAIYFLSSKLTKTPEEYYAEYTSIGGDTKEDYVDIIRQNERASYKEHLDNDSTSDFSLNVSYKDRTLVDIKPKDNYSNYDISGFEVHFIDVGQGDCTLVRCNDKVLLIDGGDNSCGTKIQNYLNKQGINTINFLISTHGDEDHSGGLDVIITKFNCENIYTCGYLKDTRTENDMYDAIRAKGYVYSNPNVTDWFFLDEALCEIIGPLSYDNVDDVNNASIVVKVTYKNNSFIFMGDAGELEEQSILNASLSNISADVIKLGHHGSNTSSSEEWINAVNPSSAVVSCELGNKYGHPHPSTLNLLRDKGIDLYRTDEEGTLVAFCDGNNITWNVPPSTTWTTGWDYQ